MKSLRCYQIFVLLTGLQTSLAAHSATLGGCLGTGTGSVALRGSNGFVASGTPTSSSNDSQATGICSVGGGGNLSGSGASGQPTGFVAAGISSRTGVSASIDALSLTGSGQATFQMSAAADRSNTLSGGASGQTMTQQGFYLSPGEGITYALTIGVEGLTGNIEYAEFYTPTLNIALTDNTGAASTFVSGSQSPNPNIFSTQAFTGQLINTTGALALYTLTAATSYNPGFVVGTGSGMYPTSLNVGDDYFDYYYNLDVKPIPLPASAWLLLSTLIALSVSYRRDIRS